MTLKQFYRDLKEVRKLTKIVNNSDLPFRDKIIVDYGERKITVVRIFEGSINTVTLSGVIEL